MQHLRAAIEPPLSRELDHCWVAVVARHVIMTRRVIRTFLYNKFRYPLLLGTGMGGVGYPADTGRVPRGVRGGGGHGHHMAYTTPAPGEQGYNSTCRAALCECVR